MSPASGWFNAGPVSVAAAQNGNYIFTGFSGGLSGTATPQNFQLNDTGDGDGELRATPGFYDYGYACGESFGCHGGRQRSQLHGDGGAGCGKRV